MIPLGLLSPGDHGKITAIRSRKGGVGEPSMQPAERDKEEYRMEDMGLRIGKIVEMLNNGGGGPILLKVDESRIAVDRGMAMKIMVTEVRQ